MYDKYQNLSFNFEIGFEMKSRNFEIRLSQFDENVRWDPLKNHPRIRLDGSKKVKFLYTKLLHVTQPVNVQLSKTELKRIFAAESIPLTKSFRRLSSVLSYVSRLCI